MQAPPLATPPLLCYNLVIMKKLRETGFIKEFKEFINQGNAMDLAIGVVIGTAFSAIVTSLVNDIIMPLISLIGGGSDFTQLSITIPNLFGGDTAAVIHYGNFIQNVVDFLLIAFSIFLMVRLMNRMRKRAKKAAEKATEKIALKKGIDPATLKKDEEDEEKDPAVKATEEQTKLLKEILKEVKKSNKK